MSRAITLSALTALFALRVIGQLLVACAAVPWLPPMDTWYSGLLPYPILLPVQLVILGVQIAIDRQVWRGRGPLARPDRRTTRWLRWFAVAYALAMLLRLAVTRSHAIPVVFHHVLAAYLFVLGGSPPGRRGRPRAGV